MYSVLFMAKGSKNKNKKKKLAASSHGSQKKANEASQNSSGLNAVYPVFSLL